MQLPLSPRRTTLLAVSSFALGLAACGAQADTNDVTEVDLDSHATSSSDSEPPIGPPPRPLPTSVSAQNSASCLALPAVPPQQPTLSYEQACALGEFVPAAADMAHGQDAGAQLVGRWELCGSEALYGSNVHAGVEFGSNGRDQLLSRQNGALVPVADGPTGEYTLLASGQFMQRGELSLDEYAVFMEFDESGSALRFTSQTQGELRYARVAPDLQSAAANRFSTQG
ncbi:MAG TPA: hypothetical protein VJU61_25530, partial [Polyangiaceae bacterium]|nr:hypothetical protein [Polyangiaceae bacterium]